MMYENEKTERGHVGYDYREITGPRELSSRCRDSYPGCGGEADPNHEAAAGGGRVPRHSPAAGQRETVTLCFRRNRSIRNKAELTRLQRNFDSCVAELQALERAKTASATIAALVAALTGTAFMAGATFAAVAEPPIIWLTILRAIPGCWGWILPVFLYRRLVRKRTAEIKPLQEQKYDEIDTICEKGSRLLH